MPFKFDWKAGTVADLVSEATVSMLGTTQPTMKMAMRLTIGDHPEGRVVGTAAVGSVMSGGQAMPDMAGVAGASQNQFVVGVDGRYRRLADTAKARQNADSMAAALLAKMAGAPPSIRSMMQKSFTVARLEEGSRQAWEQQTGGFLTRTWKVGQVHMDTIQSPSPLGPGQTMATPQRTTVMALVPCDSAANSVAAAPRCAHVRRVSTLDAATMKAAVQTMMREMLPEGAHAELGGAVPEITTETTTDMVIEVETLLIRKLSTRMLQNMTMMGTAQSTDVRSVTTYTYTTR